MSDRHDMTDRHSTSERTLMRLLGGALVAVSLLGCSTAAGNAAGPTDTTPAAATQSSSTLALPADFPDSIPVLPGPIVVSTATGSGTERTWVVEVLVDDLATAQQNALDEMRAAGFTVDSEQQVDADTWDAVLTRQDYVVRLRVYREADTGELEIRYVVAPGSGQG
ncbi:MAG: hypothetical protein ACR2KE_09440 [Candidatus Nanopelagicales bacterium]